MAVDPAQALLGAIGAPFGARLLVAWTVELRLRGLVGSPNLQPRRERSDYPSPNDPLPAILVGLLVFAIGWPVAKLLATVLPSAAIDVALVVSMITSAGYALLRIHADDRRTLELLSAPLASQVTLPDT